MLLGEMFGDFFGYPKCCQKSFYEGIRSPNIKLDGTGYIACPECNKKSEQELIEIISKNRICKKPFPHGTCVDGDEFTEEFLEYKNKIELSLLDSTIQNSV